MITIIYLPLYVPCCIIVNSVLWLNKITNIVFTMNLVNVCHMNMIWYKTIKTATFEHYNGMAKLQVDSNHHLCVCVCGGGCVCTLCSKHLTICGKQTRVHCKEVGRGWWMKIVHLKSNLNYSTNWSLRKCNLCLQEASKYIFLLYTFLKHSTVVTNYQKDGSS